MDEIIAFFNGLLKMNDAEIQALRQICTFQNVRRGQLYLCEGDVCRQATFVIKGIFKKYKVDENGKTINLAFVGENEFFFDIESYTSDAPSKYFYESMENAQILKITKDEALLLMEKFPTFTKRFYQMLCNMYVDLEKKHLNNISKNALERYKQFLEQYQNFSERIPDKEIASSLGITPVFLSKLRNKLN